MVEKKHLQLGVVALAAVALIVGLAVGVTQSNKNKNNSVAASAMDYSAYDFDECSPSSSKSSKSSSGSSAKSGKSEGGKAGKGSKSAYPGCTDPDECCTGFIECIDAFGALDVTGCCYSPSTCETCTGGDILPPVQDPNDCCVSKDSCASGYCFDSAEEFCCSFDEESPFREVLDPLNTACLVCVSDSGGDAPLGDLPSSPTTDGWWPNGNRRDRDRKLVVPGTEDYAEELGENKRRKLRNDLVRELSSKGYKSGKGSKSSKGYKGGSGGGKQQAPADASDESEDSSGGSKGAKSCPTPSDICDAGKSGKGSSGKSDKGGSGSKSDKGSGKSDKGGSGSKSDKGDSGKADKGGSGSKSDKGGSGKSGKGTYSPAPTVCDTPAPTYYYATRTPTTRPPTTRPPTTRPPTTRYPMTSNIFPEPTPAPSAGSTPTVSTDATGPPTKAGRSINPTLVRN